MAKDKKTTSDEVVVKSDKVTIVAPCGKEKEVTKELLKNYIGKGWEEK